MKSQLIAVLEKIVENSKTHARWLNTLSYLEYIGARKIMKSQRAEDLSVTLLAHMSEEARHALFFKKMSLRIEPNFCVSYSPDHLLVPDSANEYFQTLDDGCQQRLSTDFANPALLTYGYVTLLVEERALLVYEVYQEILKKHNLAVSMLGVLQEETQHLNDILSLLKNGDPNFAERKRHLSQLENGLYQKFIASIEKAVFSESKEGETWASLL